MPWTAPALSRELCHCFLRRLQGRLHCLKSKAEPVPSVSTLRGSKLSECKAIQGSLAIKRGNFGSLWDCTISFHNSWVYWSLGELQKSRNTSVVLLYFPELPQGCDAAMAPPGRCQEYLNKCLSEHLLWWESSLAQLHLLPPALPCNYSLSEGMPVFAEGLSSTTFKFLLNSWLSIV